MVADVRIAVARCFRHSIDIQTRSLNFSTARASKLKVYVYVQTFERLAPRVRRLSVVVCTTVCVYVLLDAPTERTLAMKIFFSKFGLPLSKVSSVLNAPKKEEKKEFTAIRKKYFPILIYKEDSVRYIGEFTHFKKLSCLLLYHTIIYIVIRSALDYHKDL